MNEFKEESKKKHGFVDTFAGFPELMRYRVRDILIVSSLYDSFLLGEEGGMYELLHTEYMGLNLSHTPSITHVHSGSEAIHHLRKTNRFDLIIVTLHLEDMQALRFARTVREMGMDTPVVLLTYDEGELNSAKTDDNIECIDKTFMWQGDFKILIAIIKCIEDFRNIARDTRLAGVQSVILIEDNVKFYSSYLPIIYFQLMKHSRIVINQGINITHKMLRMRARPRVIMCHTYEDAWEYFGIYKETILGVISDLSFPMGGKVNKKAGIEFTKNVKKIYPDIPILIQSNEPNIKNVAKNLGASFLRKNSPRLLHLLRDFIQEHFGFGDFIFRMPDGQETARAQNLHELEDKIRTIPDESLLFHARSNHFSKWLKARTEFYLAHKLRPQKVSDYRSTDDLRNGLIGSLRDYRAMQSRGKIIDFDPESYDPEHPFTCIGSGSLGGKGRGLAFLGRLLNTTTEFSKYENVQIAVPPSVIIKTDVFDDFIEANDLGEFAINSNDDREIEKRFLESRLPDHAMISLREMLKFVDYPVAVRSSSLLEDSQYQPFAGVYETFYVPNNHTSLEARLVELTSAIKRVYASTYASRAKRYISATPYRMEEEKMAIVIQKLVGLKHKDRFYPDFSGVGRSHNFYPIKPMAAEDGIVSAALGFGAMVVEGGRTTRFCPKYPRHLVQFSTVADAIKGAQREFYALELPDPENDFDHTQRIDLLKLGLETAEEDDVLGPLGSTYSPENESLYDGTSRPGIRIVSFASILKTDYFPLPEILTKVLQLGRKGMNTPVEIEFSVNLSVPLNQKKEFHLLQLRPMVLSQEREQFDLKEYPADQVLSHSTRVLGNGLIDSLHDIVVVDPDKFSRSKTVEIAREVGLFNLELLAEKRNYLLIGMGRWGTADHWLGIPVTWDEITAAKVIIETGFKDMDVALSQGTHFFQNLNAFKIGYFNIKNNYKNECIDWDWLKGQSAIKERKYTRHIQLKNPLTVKMDGQKSEGLILKP